MAEINDKTAILCTLLYRESGDPVDILISPQDIVPWAKNGLKEREGYFITKELFDKHFKRGK